MAALHQRSESSVSIRWRNGVGDFVSSMQAAIIAMDCCGSFVVGRRVYTVAHGSSGRNSAGDRLAAAPVRRNIAWLVLHRALLAVQIRTLGASVCMDRKYFLRGLSVAS